MSLKQDYPGEMQVLVADDGSTDRTAELARRRAADDAPDRCPQRSPRRQGKHADRGPEAACGPR